jgi:hypothetical protein
MRSFRWNKRLIGAGSPDLGIILVPKADVEDDMPVALPNDLTNGLTRSTPVSTPAAAASSLALDYVILLVIVPCN